MEAQPSPAGSPGAITSTVGERKQDKVTDQVNGLDHRWQRNAWCCVYPSCRTPG